MRRENDASFLKETSDLVAYGASWGIGYGVMWASKWVIATAVTGKNYITQSLEQIQWRTSNVTTSGDTLAATAGLKNCVAFLQLPQNKVVLIGGLILILFIIIRNRRNGFNALTRMCPFVFISVVPVIWLIVTCNHSFIHSFFTYRNLAATIFALYSGLLAHIRSENYSASKRSVI